MAVVMLGLQGCGSSCDEATVTECAESYATDAAGVSDPADLSSYCDAIAEYASCLGDACCSEEGVPEAMDALVTSYGDACPDFSDPC